MTFFLVFMTFSGFLSSCSFASGVDAGRTCNFEIDSWKSGKCPSPDYSVNCIWCYDQCRSDSDCGRQQKCCPQPNCGNNCVDIAPPLLRSSRKVKSWGKKVFSSSSSSSGYKYNPFRWTWRPHSRPASTTTTTRRPNTRPASMKKNDIIELTARFKSVPASESPDGVAKEIITINDMFPGPTIRAKIGDTLTIRVHNRLQDKNGTKHETSVHYHGIEMKLEPWMDGPELVTQCPIPYGQHMDYTFTLHQSGSYWYHSHHQWQYIDGFWGWLIVDNMPDNMTAYSHTSGSVLKDVHPYDDELIISLMDWYWKPGGQLTRDHEMSMAQGSPSPDSILINGKGNAPCFHARNKGHPNCDETRSQRVTVFNVIPHRTYRLRLLNPSAKASFNFSIDGHKMRVIEVDGVDTTLGRPVDVITLWPAQRYSVLVNMHSSEPRPGHNYFIRADMIDSGTRVDQATVYAFIHYLSWKSPPPSCGQMLGYEVLNLINKIEKGRKRSTGGGRQGRPCDNTVPWEDLTVMGSMPKPGAMNRAKLVDNMDKGETYLQASCLSNELQVSGSMRSNQNLVLLDQEWCDPVIVNRDGTHTVEPAPRNVHHTVVLNATLAWLVNGRAYSTHGQRLPAIFRVMGGEPVPHEFRPHHTQLGQTVQIVINNMNPVLHPYHLHGHTFYVMGTGKENDGPFNPNNPEHQRIISGQAMRRDTTHTLRNSWSVVRIVTNNPGVWILHCHIHWHLDKGLAAVFIEGEQAQREKYTIPEEARRVCKLSGITLPARRVRN